MYTDKMCFNIYY